MREFVTVEEAIVGISFTYLLTMAANDLFMDTCDQAPLRSPKMQDHQLLTLHWRLFSGWGREHLSTCLLYTGCQYIRKWQCSTIVNILQLTVRYLNATINIKTQNVEPEIEPNGCSWMRRNLRVDGYAAGFGPPRSSRASLWTVPDLNWTVFLVQTRTTGGLPGRVGNTNPVAPTVADRHFGSVSGSKLTRCQIGSPGCQ